MRNAHRLHLFIWIAIFSIATGVYGQTEKFLDRRPSGVAATPEPPSPLPGLRSARQAIAPYSSYPGSGKAALTE